MLLLWSRPCRMRVYLARQLQANNKKAANCWHVNKKRKQKQHVQWSLAPSRVAGDAVFRGGFHTVKNHIITPLPITIFFFCIACLAWRIYANELDSAACKSYGPVHDCFFFLLLFLCASTQLTNWKWKPYRERGWCRFTSVDLPVKRGHHYAQ